MNEQSPITLRKLRAMHAAGEKIAMLTCYDASFAKLEDAAGVDVLLIGDSLGMVVQGRPSTVPVTMDEMVYHTTIVARAVQRPWVIADMPYGSYHESPDQAMRNASRLMQAGAHMVKLEGGGWTTPTVRFLVERGVPVCGHLGLTPQSVHALGGYRVQGRDDAAAELMIRHAVELAEAGAEMIVVELVPASLGRTLQEKLPIPVIGIGAGSGTAGQVLVMHDMLNVTRGKLPRFVRNFMEGSASIEAAFKTYVTDVKSGRFPDDTIHSH